MWVNQDQMFADEEIEVKQFNQERVNVPMQVYEEVEIKEPTFRYREQS